MKNGLIVKMVEKKKMWHIMDVNDLITGIMIKFGNNLQIDIINPKISHLFQINKNIKNEIIRLETIIDNQ